MSSSTSTKFDLLYGLNEVPPAPRLILYGLQWLFIFLPMLSMVSILAADVLGLSPAEKTAFFQRLLIVVGGTMIFQTLWGHRLPLIDGPAMALVISMAALAPFGQAAVGGGMIFGALLVLLCGLFGLMRFLVPLFTDRVVGVVLLLIGLTMMPYLMPMLIGVGPDRPHGSPFTALTSLGLITVMALMAHYFKGLLRSLSIFIGIIIGTAAFAALGQWNLAEIGPALWFSVPDPAWGPRPEFNLGGAVSFALAYLAVLVNSAGSLFSVEPLVNPGGMEKRLDRSLILTGLSGLAAGGAGVVGTVPFSASPGVIAVTRVGSRFPLTACGLLLLALGFLGKLSALFTSVPNAVVGAALAVGIAAQVGVGVESVLRESSRLTNRDYMIIGLPILLGAAAGMLPEAFRNQLPAALRPLIGNGLIVGVTLVLLLEHVILRRRD